MKFEDHQKSTNILELASQQISIIKVSKLVNSAFISFEFWNWKKIAFASEGENILV